MVTGPGRRAVLVGGLLAVAGGAVAVDAAVRWARSQPQGPGGVVVADGAPPGPDPSGADPAGAGAGRTDGTGGTGGPGAGRATDPDGLLGPLLPIVRNSRTPLVRTSFDDRAAWRRVAAALTGGREGGWSDDDESLVDAVTDRRYESLDPARLATGWPPDLLGYVVVADARTMAEVRTARSTGAVSVLYVDLWSDLGSTFRVAVDKVPEVSANLSIANMDFFEFADAVGPDGVFRGFE